jgi:hypothetical protein
LRDGDVVVVAKYDRLSRSLQDLLSIVEAVGAQGAGFRSLSEDNQANLSRDPQFREGWQMRQRMGCCPQSVRYPIPRTVQQMTRQTCMGWAS